METKYYNIWCKHSSYYWAYTKSCCFHTIKLVFVSKLKLKLQKYTKKLFLNLDEKKNYTKRVFPPANFCMFARSRREEIFQILLFSVLRIIICPSQVHKNWYFIDSLNFLALLKSVFRYLVKFSLKSKIY